VILALDFGSTSFKAAVLDERLRVHGFYASELQHRFAAGGRVELETAAATAALEKAIRAAITAAGIRAARLQAVAMTSQAQTFTLVDKAGRPRMPFISWQDTRAVCACEELRRSRAMRDFGRHCSFGSLVPPLLLCQLKHLRRTRPRFVGAVDIVVCLPTFFVQRWCGIAAIDENLAAMSGLYSLAMRAWWPDALRLCGLRSSQLPGLRPLGGIAGHTIAGAKEFGLPRGIPVILAGNDQTAGAYAARLDENHGLLATLGTALATCIYVETMPRPDPALIRGRFPGGGWYRMAAESCGGSVINWAKTILAGCETDEMFFKQAAQSPPGCRGLRFELSCDQSRGHWSNIGFHHSPSDFARSVLESLARRMSELIRQLAGRVERTPVLVAGGGSHHPLWVRILSETLAAKVKATDGRPLVGAARMAWKTLAGIRT
jgi:sugar (pentulose or hexulose) kinase